MEVADADFSDSVMAMYILYLKKSQVSFYLLLSEGVGRGGDPFLGYGSGN